MQERGPFCAGWSLMQRRACLAFDSSRFDGIPKTGLGTRGARGPTRGRSPGSTKNTGFSLWARTLGTYKCPDQTGSTLCISLGALRLSDVLSEPASMHAWHYKFNL